MKLFFYEWDIRLEPDNDFSEPMCYRSASFIHLHLNMRHWRLLFNALGKYDGKFYRVWQIGPLSLHYGEHGWWL